MVKKEDGIQIITTRTGSNFYKKKLKNIKQTQGILKIIKMNRKRRLTFMLLGKVLMIHSLVELSNRFLNPSI